METSAELLEFQRRTYLTRPGVQQTPPVLRGLLMEKLAHLDGNVMWDIGAGSGSIAIEWKLYKPDARVFALERYEDRCFDIYRNAKEHEAEVHIINRYAEPAVLDILPQPDLIYHGCPGESASDLYPMLWDYLAPGGCMVSNAVSAIGVQRVNNALEAYGGAITIYDAFGLVRHQWIAHKPLDSSGAAPTAHR